jgi:hypothetical protein
MQKIARNGQKSVIAAIENRKAVSADKHGMARILAEIGHCGWLKSTIVLAEVRLLLSKISK